MLNKDVAAEAGTYAPAEAQWVVFRCGGQRFGLPLERVSEILAPRPFTRLPGAGPEICGLVGVRGRVVTVLDLGIALGLSGAGQLPDHRLLLLDIDGRRIGAAVDEVVEIAAAPLERGAAETDVGAGAVVIGVGRSEEGAFTVLDPAPLIARLMQA